MNRQHGMSPPISEQEQGQGARFKGILWTVFIAAAVAGFITSIYEWGYYRGHYAGQLAMKCAIFGVLDKLGAGAGQRDERYSFVNLGCRNDRSAPAKPHGKQSA